MAEAKIVKLCVHCGNKTNFKLHGMYTHEDYTYEWDDENERNRTDECTRTTWQLLECQTCSQPTLEEASELWDVFYSDKYGEYASGPSNGDLVNCMEIGNKVVYPTTNTQLSNLPLAVEKRYIEALRVKHISPSAFAVMIGRTLEAVFNDKEIKGKMLGTKLGNLVDSDLIPPNFIVMAKQINELRMVVPNVKTV